MENESGRDALRELTPTGTLRAAINLGNPVLAQRERGTGALAGITVELAKELGRRLGVEVKFVPYDGAVNVFEAAHSNEWDVAFLAIDPNRAREILFTAPYVVIEGTYVVREDSLLRTQSDFDRPGVRICVGRGAAYDLFLTRTLKHAELVRHETSAGAMQMFLEQGFEAAAGVRQPLEEFAQIHSGLRVIPGRFTAIEQAMTTPKGRLAAREYLHGFIEEMKRSGFVASALKRTGQAGAGVAPASDRWPVC